MPIRHRRVIASVVLLLVLVAFPGASRQANEQELLARLSERPTDTETLIQLAKLYVRAQRPDEALAAVTRVADLVSAAAADKNY
jgi:thioredoxin-like negative regulator of GroEL